MKLWNMSGFGKFLCWMGLLLAVWVIAQHLSEESFLAVISRCVVSQDGPDALTYSPWAPRISCNASYRRNGQDINAELHARQPSDYDPERESRLAEVLVSPLNPHVVRFKKQSRDWQSPAGGVLGLEFFGLLLIVMARRAQSALVASRSCS